ncbi:uncharacterized protein [Mytilus edulis]|uniref:uncharacterized protein n=1 Tax=Mytilus edulis TaxID=6550 RepID=UPI0039EE8CB9
MVDVFVLFTICCMNFDFVFCSDDRISRLEKVVEAQNIMILDLKKAFHTQNIKIDSLENQLKSCKSCGFNGSNDTGAPLSRQTVTSGNENNQVTPLDVVRVPNNILHKDLNRNSRLLLSGSNGDSSPIIAFHAYLSKTEADPGHHHTIIFDSILTNSGNGYNNHTGAFIAPEKGLYVFAFTVAGVAGSRMPVQLVVNTNIIGATTADSLSDTPTSTASSVVIIYLNQCDTCFLRTPPNTDWIVGSLYSHVDWSRSSFSGWKL